MKKKYWKKEKKSIIQLFKYEKNTKLRHKLLLFLIHFIKYINNINIINTLYSILLLCNFIKLFLDNLAITNATQKIIIKLSNINTTTTTNNNIIK